MNSSQQTLRFRCLPVNVDEDDIMQFFGDRINKSVGKKIIQSIGPFCEDSNTATKSTTISFSSNNTAQKALGLDRSQRILKGHVVELDHEFLDITTLYRSDNPSTGKPDIDIVALHGLTGHAWNTFTKSETLNSDTNNIQDINWLRDLLPDLLENNAPIRYRIMTFGYDADVWMSKSVADIHTYVGNLLKYLEVERKEDPERPIIFVGHSLGGLVVKDAIASWADHAILNTYPKNQEDPIQRFNFPVAGCVLFGVPNRGTNIANKLSGFLTLLNSVFSIAKKNVTDLEAKSRYLMEMSSRFRDVQKEHNIPVLSIYETEKWNKAVGLIVDEDSAVFDYKDKPQPFGIQKTHRDMVKFSHKSDHGLQPVSHFIASASAHAVASRFAREQVLHSFQSASRLVEPAPRDQEDLLAILRACDTIFLVDDSPSMRKMWDGVMKILEFATNKATEYDLTGIDIHFMNNMPMNADNIRSYTRAKEILSRVDPIGSTPLYDQLCRHLNDFMDRFDKDGKKVDFPNYNLIVLTDGEPNAEEEDDDEISDEEDAEQNQGAYRLIRKKIVEVADYLKEKRARKHQLGIQFCQIGNDAKAERFFQYLDDEIKKKYKLKFDLIDTVKCSSFQDITLEFLEKLLVGAMDPMFDKKRLASTALPTKNAPTRSISSSTHATNASHHHTGPERALTGVTLTNSTHAGTGLEPLRETCTEEGEASSQQEDLADGPTTHKCLSRNVREYSLPHRPTTVSSREFDAPLQPSKSKSFGSSFKAKATTNPFKSFRHS